MSTDTVHPLWFETGWVESWAATLGRGQSLHPLTLAGFSGPFVLAKGRYEGFRCLQLPGAALVPDCEELPLRSGDTAARANLSRSLADSLRDSGADALLLQSVRQGSETLAWADGLDGASLRAVIRPSAEVFVATLAEDWETQVSSLRPKLVADTNRGLRRLEEREQVRFERVTTQPEATEAMAFIAHHKQAMLDARGQPTMFTRAETLDFCERIADRFLDDERLHLSRVVVGERVAAAHLGYRLEQRFYYSVPTFDRELARFAPGRLLLFWLVEQAIASGVKVFDLGAGDVPYKHDFKPQRSPLFTVVVCRDSLRGRLAGHWFGRVRPSLAALSPTRLKRWLSRAGISRQ